LARQPRSAVAAQGDDAPHRRGAAAAPEKYRVVFWLRDVEQLSTRETAEALGISEANVKVRLLRARLMLREYLTRLFGADAEQILTHND
jgi:DNA-directed RNA polymerase specialized sigma24 family protein